MSVLPVHEGVVGLELDELLEGGVARGGGARKLGMVLMQELLLVLLGEVDARPHLADGVPVQEEGVPGPAGGHAQAGHV